jgi:hypothetical protein
VSVSLTHASHLHTPSQKHKSGGEDKGHPETAQSNRSVFCLSVSVFVWSGL